MWGGCCSEVVKYVRFRPRETRPRAARPEPSNSRIPEFWTLFGGGEGASRVLLGRDLDVMPACIGGVLGGAYGFLYGCLPQRGEQFLPVQTYTSDPSPSSRGEVQRAPEPTEREGACRADAWRCPYPARAMVAAATSSPASPPCTPATRRRPGQSPRSTDAGSPPDRTKRRHCRRRRRHCRRRRRRRPGRMSRRCRSTAATSA